MSYDTRVYNRQYLILGSDPLLTAARSIAVAGGLFIQDGGPGNALTISASGSQPLATNLTALSSYNTNGFVTQTGAGVFAGRTLAAADGLTIQESGTVITISASGVTGGSGGLTASTITTNATAAVNTVTFVSLVSGNVSITLPSPTSQGGKECVVKITANTVPPNTLTINASALNGSATMDGQATLSSQYVYDCFSFISDNSNLWAIRV